MRPVIITLWTLSLLSASCDAAAPAQLTPEAVPPQEIAQPGAASRMAPVELQGAPAWRWTYHGAASVRQGAPMQRHVQRAGQRIQLIVDVEPERVRVVSWRGDEQVWSYTLNDAPFVPGGVMIAIGGNIIVADHSRIATGCKLIALDADTGALKWRSTLVANGEVSHSKYRNDVQLGELGGRLVVYGLESAGRYIEVVDVATGRTLRSFKPDDRLLAWSSWGDLKQAVEAPSQPDPGAPSAVVAALDGERLVGRDASGARRWEAELGAMSAPGAPALVPWADSFVVTRRASDSVAGERMVEAFDAESGRLIWQERWLP